MAQKRTYIAVVIELAHGDWFADFPDIPGCVVNAGSLDIMRRHAPRELQSYIEETLRRGGAIASPRTHEEIARDEEYPYTCLIEIEVESPDPSGPGP
jgi:predicted RNase H-like HicB family nuclease